MMFLGSALAALLYAADAAPFNGQLAGRRLNVQKLLKNAVKVDKHGRRLEGNVQIDGSYSIRFNSCISLSTEGDADNIFADDVIEYTKEGKVMAETNVVLFNVCQSEYCSYGADNENLYMVDLASYMGALIDYYPTKRQDYCTACQDAQNWCEEGRYQTSEETDDGAEAETDDANANADNADNADAEAEAADGENADAEAADGENADAENADGENADAEEANADGEGDAGGRKLSESPYVDCDICSKMGCFASNDDAQGGIQDISDWAQNFLECQDTGYQYNGIDLYAKFTCNAQATGVEIGLYFDEECVAYTSLTSYKEVAADDDYTYLSKSQSIVTYPFTTAVSCAAIPDYQSPENEGQDAAEEDDGEAGDANEFCQNLFEDVLLLSDCDQDGEADEVNNEVEEEKDDEYNFYSYLLSQDNADDPEQVCKVVQSLQGEYKTVYKSSGSTYDYSHEDDTFKKSEAKSGSKLGRTFGIIIGVLVAVAIVGFFIYKSTKSSSDSKKQPLVNKSGSLA